MLSDLISYTVWGFMAIIKFAITPSLMVSAGYSWWEIITVTSIGAAIGVAFFYNLGKIVFDWWSKFRLKSSTVKKPKNKNTTKRRRILKFKKKYGLKGLLLIAGILSVPISAVLASKYFSKNKKTPYYLIISFICWSGILTFLSMKVKMGFS